MGQWRHKSPSYASKSGNMKKLSSYETLESQRITFCGSRRQLRHCFTSLITLLVFREVCADVREAFRDPGFETSGSWRVSPSGRYVLEKFCTGGTMTSLKDAAVELSDWSRRELRSSTSSLFFLSDNSWRRYAREPCRNSLHFQINWKKH